MASFRIIRYMHFPIPPIIWIGKHLFIHTQRKNDAELQKISNRQRNPDWKKEVLCTTYSDLGIMHCGIQPFVTLTQHVSHWKQRKKYLSWLMVPQISTTWSVLCKREQSIMASE